MYEAKREAGYLKFIIAAVFFCSACFRPVAVADASPEGPYALLYVVDGIPNELFAKMLRDGELPNFQEHIFERGIYSKHHITVFPPLTFPAMASIFSGRYPSSHDVANFFWVNRRNARYKNYVSISYPEFEKDFDGTTAFVFDYFPRDRTLSFGLPLGVGADYARGLPDSLLDAFRGIRDANYIGKTIKQEHALAPDILIKPLKLLSLLNPAKDTNIISLLNPISRSGVVRYTLNSFSREKRRLRGETPAAVLYYEWEVDHTGYEDGPSSEEMRQELIETDKEFGRLVNFYREAGIYEQTYFFLLSDHGNVRTRYEYVPIDRLFAKQGFKTKLICHELIANAGLLWIFNLQQTLFGAGSAEGFNCLLGVSGAGVVTAFLSKDGGTDAGAWAKELYYGDLLLYPLGRGKEINVVEFINSIEGANFFLVRENEFLPGQPHKTRIVNRTGAALVSASFEKGKPKGIQYEVIEGRDPLEYTQDATLREFIGEGFHGDRAWLEMTAGSPYPDAPVQIAQAMETPLSGSVIIIPHDHFSFNSRVYGKHGGLSAGEMTSVFGAAGPRIKHGAIEYSRAVDFVPTFLSLMGKHFPKNCFDGIDLSEIITVKE